MAGKGEPIKLTPEVIEAAALLARNGHTYNLIADQIGVVRSTWNRWLAEGRAHADAGNDTLQRTLSEAITRARQECAESMLACIRDAVEGGERESRTVKTRTWDVMDEDGEIRVMKDVTVTVTDREERDWRAAIEWLQRVYPQEWGKAQRVELSGPDGGPVQIEPIEDLRKRALAEIERVVGRLGPVVLDAEIVDE